VDNEDLVMTLEMVVDKFGEDIAPYAVGLCQQLVRAFTRIQEGADAAEGDEEEEEEAGSLAAFGCLRALSTVLDSVSSLPHLFPEVGDR
jgi:importin-7